MARKPKKNNLIKFRVSEEFLDAIELFKKEHPVWSMKGDSSLYRWLILEGALKFAGSTEWDSKEHTYVHKNPAGKALQAQIYMA